MMAYKVTEVLPLLTRCCIPPAASDQMDKTYRGTHRDSQKALHSLHPHILDLGTKIRDSDSDFRSSGDEKKNHKTENANNVLKVKYRQCNNSIFYYYEIYVKVITQDKL